MKKKALIWAGIMIAAILFGYWLKCQFQINFFDTSLSNTFPFSKLTRNDIISSPNPGIVLDDSFESENVFKKWSTSLWMREPGKVIHRYDTTGMNDSRCLVIENSGDKSWSFGHNMFIEVQQGDVFAFSGFVLMHGNSPRANLRVAAYDEDKTALQWNYAKEKTEEVDTWIEVRKQFIVGDNVHYIRFGLTGTGRGVFRFDNIRFEKVGAEK